MLSFFQCHKVKCLPHPPPSPPIRRTAQAGDKVVLTLWHFPVAIWFCVFWNQEIKSLNDGFLFFSL